MESAKLYSASKASPIPVSGETDQKYTWRAIRHVLHAYSLTAGSPYVSVQGFHTYPDIEGGPMAAVLVMVLSPHAVLSLLGGVEGGGYLPRFGGTSVTQLFPFIFTEPLTQNQRQPK